jgi:hypothetical protein
MGIELEIQPEHFYGDRPVSRLGFKLRKLREAIEAAAERGEIKLLNAQELESELDDLRPSDSDLR